MESSLSCLDPWGGGEGGREGGGEGGREGGGLPLKSDRG